MRKILKAIAIAITVLITAMAGVRAESRGWEETSLPYGLEIIKASIKGGKAWRALWERGSGEAGECLLVKTGEFIFLRVTISPGGNEEDIRRERVIIMEYSLDRGSWRFEGMFFPGFSRSREEMKMMAAGAIVRGPGAYCPEQLP